jgi:hypothetical protein
LETTRRNASLSLQAQPSFTMLLIFARFHISCFMIPVKTISDVWTRKRLC